MLEIKARYLNKMSIFNIKISQNCTLKFIKKRERFCMAPQVGKTFTLIKKQHQHPSRILLYELKHRKLHTKLEAATTTLQNNNKILMITIKTSFFFCFKWQLGRYIISIVTSSSSVAASFQFIHIHHHYFVFVYTVDSK